MPEWTAEQRRAIEDRGSNILLSAAAGSGKTTVLVERVLRLIIEEGVDVDRMLVVTFTRAAASDMRAKLSRRLNERASAGDARCGEQLLKLDQASISTLHSFCSDFLRMNFETVGVDPSFRVLDDAMDDRLVEEALDAAVEEAYAAGGEALMALDYGRGPKGVRELTAALLQRMQERPDPEDWLRQIARCDRDALHHWQAEIVGAARRSLRTALVHLHEALSLPHCPENYAAAIRKDVQTLRQILSIDEYDALFRALSDIKFAAARRSAKGAAVDEDAKEQVKQLREMAKKAVADARIRKLPLLQSRRDAKALAGQIETLAAITLSAARAYVEAKAEQSGLTFADLEHLTLRALSDPAVAQSLKERYEYVFVDEYQDTSDLQEALVGAITRGNNLFMVGDVKQSIYRFRMAEPRLFMEKYAAYAKGEGGRLLPLTRNFRSRKGILDFVNLVFERTMTGGDAEVLYDEMARLNPGAEGAEAGELPDVSILLVDSGAEPRSPKQAEDEEILRLAELERQGVWIARTIKRMMEEDPTLKYRDFAILTRSKDRPFSAMMPLMVAHGIPAYADGQTGYYRSLEINWMLSMLRLIENGRRDVELIAMLRSPAVGLSAEALAQVRIAYRNVPYVDAASAYAREVQDGIARRIAAFLEQLERWRLRLSSMGLGEFVRTVLDESGFYTYAGALPGGAQRQANLDQFVVTAGGYDDEYTGSLTRFLAYVEDIREKKDGDVAHLLGENDNVVRMMSVHKSKGLEFRVVFGAQLERRYSTRPSEAVPIHRDLGAGLTYIDPDLRTRRTTLPREAIRERQSREDRAEEMRILYVMLTRARERLLLVGTVNGAEKALGRWKALASAPFAAASHLDLIMAARCGAERDGQALYSDLQVIPSADIRMQRQGEREDARAVFESIRQHPEQYADPGLDAALAWQYPDSGASARPLKLTASGLLRQVEGPEQVPVLLERPDFIVEGPRRMTGAERGTAYHRCLQLLDLRELTGLKGAGLTRAIGARLDACADRGLITDAQRRVVQPQRLARFLQSDVGLRLRSADTVRREWSFNLRMPLSEALTPAEAGRCDDGDVLVQGTIDCCFVEDDQWILLDYKTDRTDDTDALRAHYEKQLALYARALEQVTGRPVRQRLLCLLESGTVMEV